MAKNTKESILESALTVIKEQGLLFIEDVTAYMGISTSTLYKYIPATSEEMETLKRALTVQKVQCKVNLRRKWMIGSNATTDIALYKLIATEEERAILTSQTINVGNANKTAVQVLEELSDEQLIDGLNLEDEE